jgi:hypothetical protein
MPFSDPNSTSELNAVSCRSARLCAAVGDDDIGVCGTFPDITTATVPVVGFWKAGRWSLADNPDLGCRNRQVNQALYSVACAWPGTCTAVGTDDHCSNVPGVSCQQLIYSSRGGRWSLQRAPFIRGSGLAGISCPRASECTVVGAVAQGAGEEQRSALLVEQGSRRTWVRENAPMPAGAGFAAFDSVSCPTRAICVAVGTTVNQTTDIGSHHPLIEATFAPGPAQSPGLVPAPTFTG